MCKLCGFYRRRTKQVNNGNIDIVYPDDKINIEECFYICGTKAIKTNYTEICFNYNSITTEEDVIPYEYIASFKIIDVNMISMSVFCKINKFNKLIMSDTHTMILFRMEQTEIKKFTKLFENKIQIYKNINNFDRRVLSFRIFKHLFRINRVLKNDNQ